MSAPATVTRASQEQEHEDKPMVDQLKSFLFGSKINILYAFVPIAFFLGTAKINASATFIAAFFGLIPLAAALGDFTEDISKRTNDATAALINVTFGNATELIISLVALKYGHYDIITFSLIGSITGNMLLVLGTAYLLAGFKQKELYFNAPATGTYLSTLVMACLCFLIPTAFNQLNAAAQSKQTTVMVSREISVLMIFVYIAYLYFQQKTHVHMFDEAPAEEEAQEEQEAQADTASVEMTNLETNPPATAPPTAAAAVTVPAEEAAAGDDDDDDDEPEYSFWFAFFGTAVVAVLISFLSDFLVDSIEGAAEGLRLSRHFIGLVLVPIVGNVAEHASAIMMALKMKMDIAIGVALGSSVQIAMFVMPVVCLAGLPFGRDVDLAVNPFIVSTLFVSVVLTYAVSSSGTATWYSGLMLVVVYVMMAIAYLNVPDV